MPDEEQELVNWRLKALDEWRAQTDARLGAIEKAINDLVNTRKIEEAVKAGIKGARKMELTFGQKIAAFLVGSVVLADSIKGLVS